MAPGGNPLSLQSPDVQDLPELPVPCFREALPPLLQGGSGQHLRSPDQRLVHAGGSGHGADHWKALAEGGAGGSSQYALGGGDSTGAVEPTIEFGALTDLAGLGASFTNTTYSALSMRDGDGFAKKFGGADGTESDFFRLTIHGYAGGLSTGTVDFYLADFRFGDSGQDYIVDEWTFVDFSALGTVDELRFSFASSDVGAFGINTPVYFAMDDFLAVPEPSTMLVSVAGLGLLLRRRR